MVLYLTEAVDPVFSTIKVFDESGTRVDTGDTHASQSTTLRVPLKPLDSGVHTVVWRITSVSDGHTTSGSFRFTVSGGGRLFLATGGGVDQSLTDTRPTPTNTAIRWSELPGLALIAGALATLAIVLAPILVELPDSARSRLTRRIRLLGLVGSVIVSAALIADVFYRATGDFGEGTSFPKTLWEILLGSHGGELFWLRIVPVIVVALVWYRLVKTWAELRRWLLWGVAGLSMLLLLGRSLGSHAATLEDALGAASILSDSHSPDRRIHLGG